eukprot:9397502-Alexandrium_andersonii.AAC.1
MRDIARSCAVGKEVLEKAFQALVAEADGMPILTTKSADGAPISVVKRVVGHLPSGKRVRRSGKECQEFL